MSLIFHQLRKDLRHTRWLIALWVLVLLLRFCLVWANVDPSDRAWQITFQLLSMLTSLVDSLLVLVIVPLVIQQEPLTTTTAFWLTRPISRATLFASKALFGTVLLFMPLFVQGVVLLANGVGPREIALALLWLLMNQASWILIVALLASLTSSFGRFAILIVVSFIISFALMYISQITLVFGNIQAYASLLPSLTYSRSVISAFLTIGAATVALSAQYMWRQPRLAWALAVMAFFAPNVISSVWSWDFLKPASDFVDDTSIKAGDLTLGLEKHVYAYDEASFRGGLPHKMVQGTIEYGGIAPGGIIRITKLTSSLSTATNSKIPIDEPVGDFTVYSFQLDEAAIEASLGVPLINSPGSSSGINQQLFSLDSGVYEKYRDQPLLYRGMAEGIIYKYKQVAELPLKKGAEYRHGSYRLLITDVLHDPEGVDIMAREQDVVLQLALRSDQDKSQFASMGNKSVVYVLVNRKLNQAVVEKQNNMSNITIFQSSESLRHTPLNISFGPDNNFQNWTTPIDEAWLKDATLVRLEMVPVADFTKSFSYSDLYLNNNGADIQGRLITQAIRQVTLPPAVDLDQITLPPNANRRQVSDYISAIVAASNQQTKWRDTDPEVHLLEQVGPENVDLLIEAASEYHNYYLNYAIRQLAQPDHKELILRALPNNHDLIAVVVERNWQQDAKPILVSALSTVNSLPNRWIDVVAAFHDPATYPALRDYYVQHPHRAAYKSLKSIPDFDLRGAVDAAWKLINDPTRAWTTRNLLEPAAEIGEVDFPAVATQLLESGNQYDVSFARKAIREYTPATGVSDADLLNWMKANESRLVFDPTAKKFVLPPVVNPPLSPASGTPPPPPATGG